LKVGTKCTIFHPKFKGMVVGEGIASVNHASKGCGRSSLARFCGLGRQMVMVTKVYKPNVKLMIENLERNPNVWTLDETCVSSMLNKTYILWECKWLLENSSN
jgi:hypothetical protein